MKTALKINKETGKKQDKLKSIQQQTGQQKTTTTTKQKTSQTNKRKK